MTETLAQVLLNTVKSFPKDDFMLFKKDGTYVPLSTKDFGDRVRFFSLGLRQLGLRPGDRMVILSENRPEWVIRIRISFFFDVVNSCSGQRIYPPNYAGSIWPAARRCQ